MYHTHTGHLMNPEDIDISAADPLTDGPPNSVPKPKIDDFDIFQRDFT
jgi:hypothetical protein